MARLFDAYVIADWTAAEGRKTGEQSLWIGVVKRDVRFRLAYEAHNPATRAEGEKLLRTILADLRKQGQRVLLGFDFALGLPEGTAARLGLTGEPWAAVWKFMASNVVDKADNTNNRFAVAAKMNRLMTDEARPFWGAPARFTQRWMASTKPAEGYGDVPEFRRAEKAANARKAGLKPVWQMHGAGVTGGQALLGIAAVKRLADELGESCAVWPFGTGWRALDKADVEPLSTLIVEVQPALFPPVKPEPGETRTAAGVRAAAEALSRLDEKGDLAALFAPPKGAGEADVAAVQREEGWMLGA